VLPQGARGKARFRRCARQPGNALHEEGELEKRSPAASARSRWTTPGSRRRISTSATSAKDEGRLEEAAACYEKALTLAPDYAPAYVNLGNVIVKQGTPGRPWPSSARRSRSILT